MSATPKARSAAVALGAAAALLAAGLAAPAQAASTASGAVIIKNCSKTAHGVPLRVKMRIEMRSTADQDSVRRIRIRVSHPDGTGNFENSRVRRTSALLAFEGPWVNDGIGSAAWAVRRGDAPVYRAPGGDYGAIGAAVKFRLTNGKRTTITCGVTFPRD